MTKRNLLLAVLLPPLLATPAVAGKRRIAVLEFRAGTQGASDLGTRLSAVLRQSTSLTVLAPDDARREAGAEIDALVARCRGEARCVANVARKLHVDEVVLIGVSELGDVILILQRISAEGEVKSRIAESLPKGADPSDADLEAYSKRLLPPEDFRRYGTLRIRANLEGADVTIGGTNKGKTPLEPFLVPAPATIDLVVSKRGYTDYKLQINVPPEAVVEVRPVLTPRDRIWYTKWWVWAIAGGVAATAVASTAILLNGGDTVGGTLELPPRTP